MISVYLGQRCLLKGEIRENDVGQKIIHDLVHGIDLKEETVLASLMDDQDLQFLYEARQVWLEVNNAHTRKLTVSYIYDESKDHIAVDDDVEDCIIVENEIGESADIHEITLGELLSDMSSLEPEMFDPAG